MAHSKQFVVAVDVQATREKLDSFTEYLRTAPEVLAWWHWIQHVWLVVGSDELTAAKLLDTVVDLIGERNIVIEIRAVDWAGFGPIGEKKNMFTWVQKNL